jgi:hypothetical protein
MQLPVMRITKETLQLRVYPYPDEPLHGYVGRLARLHGKQSIQQFLNDYARGRITAAQVLQGEAQAEIARLVDLPEDALAASTFARTSSGKYVLNGEEIGKRNWSYRTLRVCPTCLREDQERLPGRPDFRAHIRFWWNIDAVRACPFHKTALIGDPAAHDDLLNWRALDIQRSAIGVDLVEFEAPPAEDDDLFLSQFIAVRLGLLARTSEPQIVFNMPLDWALDASGLVGELALTEQIGLAPDAAMSTDTHLARRTGYRIFRGGRGRLDLLLDSQVELLRASGSLPTPVQAYGRLYHWTVDKIGDERIEEFQEALWSHGLKHLRVSEAQKLFRGSSGNRERFSIHQAATLLRASERRLRRIVAGLDKVPRLERRKYSATDEFIDPTTLKNIDIALREARTERQAADILGVELPLMQ